MIISDTLPYARVCVYACTVSHHLYRGFPSFHINSAFLWIFPRGPCRDRDLESGDTHCDIIIGLKYSACIRKYYEQYTCGDNIISAIGFIYYYSYINMHNGFINYNYCSGCVDMTGHKEIFSVQRLLNI